LQSATFFNAPLNPDYVLRAYATRSRRRGLGHKPRKPALPTLSVNDSVLVVFVTQLWAGEDRAMRVRVDAGANAIYLNLTDRPINSDRTYRRFGKLLSSAQFWGALKDSSV
jgi:hypothetical protein